MNKYAKIVLWLGLFLIVANIVKNWSTIKGTVFTNSTSSGGGSGGSGPTGIGSKPGPHGKCPPGTTKTINGMCVPVRP